VERPRRINNTLGSKSMISNKNLNMFLLCFENLLKLPSSERPGHSPRQSKVHPGGAKGQMSPLSQVKVEKKIRNC